MLRYILLFLGPLCVFAQHNPQPASSEIYLKLKKLNFLGSVLYVAAHPDDENTRAIAYLANNRLAETAYLSMTRGDGGQNLIGSELRDQLGLIRTQELVTARQIDGGKQYFTRANDFGFSKTATETFSIWGKDQILSDVVRVYRQFQPDVVITRFPPDERAGHGHHTASALLAQEAFEVSGNKDVYPEQVASLGTWQPLRVFTNTGRFFNNNISENTPGVLVMNVGGYNAVTGVSPNEIAGKSRSQHKSQGFGSRSTRGDFQEFLELAKGPAPGKDIFEGVNTNWSRVPGGEKIQPLIDKAIKEFSFEKPSTIVPSLLQIRNEIQKLAPSVWKERKLVDVSDLIIQCLGFYFEATTGNYYGVPGEDVTVTFEVINRSSIPVEVARVESLSVRFDSTLNAVLKENTTLLFRSRKPIVRSDYSDPYWLREPHSLGLFTVNDPSLIGRPENDPAVQFHLELNVQGQRIRVSRPLINKWVDPVKGEQWRPFEITPPVFLNFDQAVYVFTNDQPKKLKVLVKSSSTGSQSGTLTVKVPDGWRIEPLYAPFSLVRLGDEVEKVFSVYPSANESEGSLQAVAEINGKKYQQSIQVISYDHIPVQTLLPLASSKVLRIDLKREGKVIGYVEGAGDEIPQALQNMGYEVAMLKDEDITAERLATLDAVVLGIRALNANKRIRFFMKELLSYVNNGGTLVVQYNTSNGLETNEFSPFPLTLSRDRVTEEDSEVRLLKPDHKVLSYPNKITVDDFKNWVQERGLYFPNKWDSAYSAPLSMNDKNEQPKDGSLLVAKYGKGYYVYTGLSFFRELPEGVSGAYKLFANLVSLKDKEPAPVQTQSKKKNGRKKV